MEAGCAPLAAMAAGRGGVWNLFGVGGEDIHRGAGRGLRAGPDAAHPAGGADHLVLHREGDLAGASDLHLSAMDDRCPPGVAVSLYRWGYPGGDRAVGDPRM